MIFAAFRLMLLIFSVALLYPFALLFHHLKKISWRDRVACFFHAMVLRICGVSVSVQGKVSNARPLLLVSNHVSYIDVSVLLSQFPVRFTPKIEIASWPVIGHFCRLVDCVFVGRKADSIHNEKLSIRRALAAGEVVCLFPEATTGNGIELLPFKTSFFSMGEEAIDGRELQVQPVAIIYKSIRRLPIDRTQWPAIAWYGDMELAPHLMDFLKLGSIQVEVRFLPSVTLSSFSDRKAMAKFCQGEIARQIEDAKK